MRKRLELEEIIQTRFGKLWQISKSRCFHSMFKYVPPLCLVKHLNKLTLKQPLPKHELGSKYAGEDILFCRTNRFGKGMEENDRNCIVENALT